mgnify:CR=1 FL=1
MIGGYTCGKCRKKLEGTVKAYGGYAARENKDLCPECWKEYLEIENRYNQEITKWWLK